MPSHQLRGRPSNAFVGAERRRPRRLHAVIRTLARDGSDALGRPRRPAVPQSTTTCLHAMPASALAPQPRGAPSGCCRAAGRCAPHRIAVPVVPRSFCPGVPMALGRRRQHSRCRAPRNEFNASAATGLEIRDAGTRNASSYRIAALARSPRPDVAGPLKRPNALAPAARAPSISQMHARRRRPCRLHAVIRRRDTNRAT